MKLIDTDIELINFVQKDKTYSVLEINLLDKVTVLKIIDNLTELIGDDSIKKDINDLGKKSDSVISKLLNILEKREDLD